ncbi:MAG: hypothetical protein ACLFV7_11875 [Phycisphaerae bacterium]
MASETIARTLQQATQQAYRRWATEHPSLATVLDELRLQERVEQSLRETPEFRNAVESYRQARCEICLLRELTATAGRLLAGLLAG